MFHTERVVRMQVNEHLVSCECFIAVQINVSLEVRDSGHCIPGRVNGRCVASDDATPTQQCLGVWFLQKPTQHPLGVFTLVTRRQNFDARVKSQHDAQWRVFDARVKILSPRHQCENPYWVVQNTLLHALCDKRDRNIVYI